ncbi:MULTISPECIES: hypothetical protein [Halorubrum]|uniref:hypothetical protein n=1 Tax=Halorubrum TaxID=56688 RepID=UPI001314B471|nr:MULTISPECIES: hypothetical protein [Halorubrum]
MCLKRRISTEPERLISSVEYDARKITPFGMIVAVEFAGFLSIALSLWENRATD